MITTKLSFISTTDLVNEILYRRQYCGDEEAQTLIAKKDVKEIFDFRCTDIKNVFEKDYKSKPEEKEAILNAIYLLETSFKVAIDFEIKKS